MYSDKAMGETHLKVSYVMCFIVVQKVQSKIQQHALIIPKCLVLYLKKILTYSFYIYAIYVDIIQLKSVDFDKNTGSDYQLCECVRMRTHELSNKCF